MNIPEGMTEDEALLASMNAESSGISDDGDDQTPENTENGDEAETPATDLLDDIDETETDSEDNEPEATEAEQPKKKSNVAKLLAERNALRKEIAELKAKQGYDDDSVEFVKKVSKDEAKAYVDEQIFFMNIPEALELQEEIKGISDTMNVSLDDAYKFFLAKTDPVKLLSEQDRNKISAGKYHSAGKNTAPQAKKDHDYSEDEFESMVASGKVKV